MVMKNGLSMFVLCLVYGVSKIKRPCDVQGRFGVYRPLVWLGVRLWGLHRLQSQTQGALQIVGVFDAYGQAHQIVAYADAGAHVCGDA